MDKNARILIVDDDKQVLRSLEMLLETEFGYIKTLHNPNQIPNLLGENSFDVILLDMNFSAGRNTGNEGIYWLKQVLKIDPDSVVVFITAYGDINLAVKAIKEGGTEFILKPFDNDKIIATLKTALELRRSKLKVNKLIKQRNHISANEHLELTYYKSKSPCMRNIYATVEKAAKTDANILIYGENGTGKELIAQEIHNLSNRASEAMIRVDLGAISDNLVESELFGHAKGAFTDAKETRTGRFELASNGTLFLDEIGNISISHQAKLLTALQERKVTPVGANKEIKFDIRLICATNKNLEQMIDDQLFREDLFYRINTITIEIPPLRKRKEDLEGLADHFLLLYSKKYNKINTKINSMAYDALHAYSWPGNIRELQHTIEKAVIMCNNNIIKPEDLMLRKALATKQTSFPKTLEEIEKEAIINALENNNGILTFAAKELGIARQTMYNKMKKYDL